MPKRVRIEIVVDENTGNFTYQSVDAAGGSPKPGAAMPMSRKGGKGKGPNQMSWLCKNGPFVVDFGASSAFQALGFRSKPDPKNKPKKHLSKKVGTVQGAAALGRYPYAVAVSTKNGVFIDACPEVDVDC